MLADEVRLEMVATTRLNGKREVSTYFTNYSNVHDGTSSPDWSTGVPPDRPRLVGRTGLLRTFRVDGTVLPRSATSAMRAMPSKVPR